MVPLERFVAEALYAPGVGYYRRTRDRVGYAAGHDFYTAESLGAVFARLVVAAVEHLVGEELGGYRFIEVGTERPGGLLAGQPHPFAGVEACGVEQLPTLRGRCILFSNELFDAQPFRRFEVVEGQWREHAVRLDSAGLAPALLPLPASLPGGLPPPPAEGYLYDLPSGAQALLEALVAPDWEGLFLAFDYGLDRPTLATERPAGTARTYREHRMGADLLASPGTSDITHHVCWDSLAEGLARAGFEDVAVATQEAFFMRESARAIEAIVALGTQRGVHPELQTLKELLHPQHMGRKFQVLRGFRGKNACHPAQRR